MNTESRKILRQSNLFQGSLGTGLVFRYKYFKLFYGKRKSSLNNTFFGSGPIPPESPCYSQWRSRGESASRKTVRITSFSDQESFFLKKNLLPELNAGSWSEAVLVGEHLDWIQRCKNGKIKDGQNWKFLKGDFAATLI